MASGVPGRGAGAFSFYAFPLLAANFSSSNCRPARNLSKLMKPIEEPFLIYSSCMCIDLGIISSGSGILDFSFIFCVSLPAADVGCDDDFDLSERGVTDEAD